MLICVLGRPYSCPHPTEGAECEWKGGLDDVLGHLAESHHSAKVKFLNSLDKEPLKSGAVRVNPATKAAKL